MAKAIETGFPKMRIEEAAAENKHELIPVKISLLELTNISLKKKIQLIFLIVDNTAVR